MSTTTPEQLAALGRRAVACKGFRGMAGMQGYALLPDGSLGARFRLATNDPDPTGLGLAWAPDLSDPATLGCLLALVRESSGNDWVNLEVYGGKWYARFAWGATPFDTEVEALVAALEAGQ